MANKSVDISKNNKNILGVTTKKTVDFAQWYYEVLTKSELIEYYEVSGCYILRPYAYEMWDGIKEELEKEFRKNGIKNCYFPIFATKSKLEAEKNHIDGFEAEVAWITKAGQNELAEPIALRPTSETIMYPIISKWVRSYRDLPMKLNQWCSVVRWEFSDPTPFIRTREFLWHECHTVHCDPKEADEFSLQMINIYANIYKNILAVPVITGIKSDCEKFAGGVKTYTVEAFINTNGKSIQAGTSHYLGNNFSKIFDIVFENETNEREHAYQTSFGLSTRSLGVIILMHGDDNGLVLPPRIAPIQLVIIPILKKNSNTDKIVNEAIKLANILKSNFRVHVDDRQLYTPGYKFNYWELKGIPLRLEIGPNDIVNNTVRIVRRVDKASKDVDRNSCVDIINEELNACQSIMYNKQVKILTDAIIPASDITDVINIIKAKKLALINWCNTVECENENKIKIAEQLAMDKDKAFGSAKTICSPLNNLQPDNCNNCALCNRSAISKIIWGRSY